MDIASVVLDIPTQALGGMYSYAVPESLEGADTGCAVLVPFGHRKAIGFIMGRSAPTEPDGGQQALREGRLKAIERVVSRPYFNEDGAACALYLAESCVAPLSTCVRLFIPPGAIPRVVRTASGWRVETPPVGVVDDRYVRLADGEAPYEPRSGAVRQKAILDALRDGELRVSELAREYGPVSGALSSLERRGAIVIERRRRLRVPDGEAVDDGAVVGGGRSERVTLTEGQEAALARIDSALSAADGSVVLIDGVTGSGKTEVYLRAIERVLSRGGRAIVLVPEISLTPQTVARFRGRFGDGVAVMHSRMSRGERFDQWDFIRSGAARVVVGARSALFTPVEDVGIIVIDEEHEGSYKQDQAPRYHARDVAVWMARRRGATVVLGSATPSIETLHACAKKLGWTRVSLPDRATGMPLPPVVVVDMAREFRKGSRSMFSARLTSELGDALKAGDKAILLLNQRGFAKFLLCRDCGFVPECPHCATSLTYHEFEGSLQCHHCGYAEAVPARCPKCASPYLRRFGAGTQRVQSELESLVEDLDVGEVRITRMDADTTKGKGAHRKLLDDFMAPGAAILLGTQMIAKGLDFEDVTLVGVINADTTLKLPDFRSAERTFDLIEQVAGRAGRSKPGGRVVVQTYWPEASAVSAAARHDRAAFLRDELPKRRILGYPPYVRMANIIIWGKDESAVRGEAGRLYGEVLEATRKTGKDRWQVLPATPCALSKLRNTYRWHIVLKAPMDEDIASVLTPLFRHRKSLDNVSAAVDIDPLSLV